MTLRLPLETPREHVERALALLRDVAPHAHDMTLGDAIERLGLPHDVGYRALQLAVAELYSVPQPDPPSPELLALGRRVTTAMQGPLPSAAELQALIESELGGLRADTVVEQGEALLMERCGEAGAEPTFAPAPNRAERRRRARARRGRS